jgi:hypothetical protein
MFCFPKYAFYPAKSQELGCLSRAFIGMCRIACAATLKIAGRVYFANFRLFCTVAIGQGRSVVEL